MRIIAQPTQKLILPALIFSSVSYQAQHEQKELKMDLAVPPVSCKGHWRKPEELGGACGARWGTGETGLTPRRRSANANDALFLNLRSYKVLSLNLILGEAGLALVSWYWF